MCRKMFTLRNLGFVQEAFAIDKFDRQAFPARFSCRLCSTWLIDRGRDKNTSSVPTQHLLGHPKNHSL